MNPNRPRRAESQSPIPGGPPEPRLVACALEPLEHDALGQFGLIFGRLELVQDSLVRQQPAQALELLAELPALAEVRQAMLRAIGLYRRVLLDPYDPANNQPQPVRDLLDATLGSKLKIWQSQLAFAVDLPAGILIRLPEREFDDIIYPLLDVLVRELLRQSSPHPSLTIRASRRGAGPTCLHFDHSLAPPAPDGPLALQAYAERLGMVDRLLARCGASAVQRRLDTGRTRLTLRFPFPQT